MKQTIYAVVICKILLCAIAYSQELERNIDSTTADFPDFTAEKLDFGDDFVKHNSSGLFPQPFHGSYIGLSSSLFGDIWDQSRGFMSRSFVPTKFPFTGSNPFRNSDERSIYKPNSKDEFEGDYPATSFSQYNVWLIYNTPYHVVFRSSLSYSVANGVLFSEDNTRSFLTLSGFKRGFREIGVIHVKDYSLGGTLGFEIPIYGGFVDVEATKISSYYYVSFSVHSSYSVSTWATQYSQIADVKDELRFRSGSDTVRIVDDVHPTSFENFRYYYECTIGWRFSGVGSMLSFEPFILLPQKSIFTDSEWKQVIGGFRLSLLFDL